jgi:hypothetical protein
MKPSAVFSAVSLAVTLTVSVSLASAATPPPAKSWKSSLTAPTTATAATVHISKSSSAQVKVSTGLVTFKLKVKVLDGADLPVNSTGNTATFTFLVGGMTKNKDFGFDIVDGKGVFKIPVSLTDAATWGTMLAVGATIEMRQVRLYETGTGELFGVDGFTTK